VSALLVPALTAHLHTPARGHEHALSVIVSIVLLLLFVGSLPGTLKRTPEQEAAEDEATEGLEPEWSLGLAIGMLAVAGIGAAFVSDWFVVGASFTLVLSPLLVAVLVIAVIVTVIVVFDGESTWFEGLSLVALYGVIATAFWWG
jgi:Ca2+:H+ antiporter